MQVKKIRAKGVAFFCVCLVVTLSTSAGRAECRLEEGGSVNAEITHFVAPPARDPGLVGFQLADLRVGGEDELIVGGHQASSNESSYAPSFSILSARVRTGEFSYETRAALPLLGEYLVAAIPVDGNAFGVNGTAVLAITRARELPQTRFRVIDGSTWSSVLRCDLDFAATAAQVGPDIEGGALRLYLQDASTIHVYSLTDFHELRVLDGAGGTGFVLAQLDDSESEEVVVAAMPGRVIDALSGEIKWEYAPGWYRVGTGRFGFNTHPGIVALEGYSVGLFSASPYARMWGVDHQEFTPGPEVFAVADVDGDQRDEVLVAEGYSVGQQYIYSVRVFDTLTHNVLVEDHEPAIRDIVALAAVPGRTAGSIEIIEALENSDLRTHALGASDPSWLEIGEGGPFKAIAKGHFGIGEQDAVVFGGYASLHVIGLPDWLQASTSPPPGSPNALPFGPADIVALEPGNSQPTRLGIGGTNGFGAVMDLNPIDWSTNWQFGVINDPNQAPLGGRQVTRMLAYDVNGDGADDVIAGAYDGGSSLGAVVAAFDGLTGSELWRSQSLGGAYSNVIGLTIAHHELPETDVLLAAGMDTLVTDTLYAFDLHSGALQWSVPEHAYVVAPMGGDAIVVGTTDNRIRALDSGHQLLWEDRTYAAIDAVSLPFADGPVLVSSGARLRWLDAGTGAQLGVSKPIATSLAASNRWLLNPDAQQRSVIVTAGSDAGLFEVRISMPAVDEIFYDGSE
jgi:hypothetical protein